MAHKRVTSKPVARKASVVLRSKRTSSTTKSIAGSALSQSHGKYAEEMQHGKVSMVQYIKSSSRNTRSIAGSAQLQSSGKRTKSVAPQKAPEKSSAISEFMRNGSVREHERVFKKVIEESIAEQRKIIERSEQLRLQRAAASGVDST